MKNAAICTVAGGLAFVLMALQFDWSSEDAVTEAPAVEAKTLEKKQAAPAKTSDKPVAKKAYKPKFPQDLAPALSAYPVPEAAAFSPSDKIYPMVFLKTSGLVYQEWQDRLNEGWCAETVEDTQLVVVLGPHRKIFVNRTDYPNGAPPIDRFRWELEVSVVEAKTGKVRANRSFANVPRAIKPREAWELTEIGAPVAFKTVYNWVVSNARVNFPDVANPNPLVTVVE